jgi:hypothetical protein
MQKKSNDNFHKRKISRCISKNQLQYYMAEMRVHGELV